MADRARARGKRHESVVLLADPVNGTRALLTLVFAEELGARVVAVDGPDQLLLMAREVRAHLIVLEIDARHQNGLDAVRHLKSDPAYQDVPVLVFTAWGQLLSCDDARAAGCDACIAKPFDLDEVVDLARGLLRPRSA